MITIMIHLNNCKTLEIKCDTAHKAYDVHTLARQISTCPLVAATNVGLTVYHNGEEELGD